MMAWQARLPIEPVAKQRPRLGRGCVYTPKETVAFERQVKSLMMFHKPRELMQGPLNVEIDFFVIPPKRTKNKLPSVKPDLDNFIKSLTDALNGIVWIDDAQICVLKARKFYDWTRKKGFIDVRVSEVGVKEK